MVHHHGGHLAVFIQERGAEQGASAAGCAHPFRVGADKFGEVADVIIGGRVD